MKKIALMLMALLSLSACQNTIKNTQRPVQVEPGTDTSALVVEEQAEEAIAEVEQPFSGILGHWVGDFEVDRSREKDYEVVDVDAGVYWNRSNKINISIDQIIDDKVTGHSVVAGNDRPFSGTVEQLTDENGHTVRRFEVKEPGDDRYDGTFRFEIVNEK